MHCRHTHFYGHFPHKAGLAGCSLHFPSLFVSNLCILSEQLTTVPLYMKGNASRNLPVCHVDSV